MSSKDEPIACAISSRGLASLVLAEDDILTKISIGLYFDFKFK